MYSGSTLKQLKLVDTWLGAHQKIDRVAYKRLSELVNDNQLGTFPRAKSILRFEGMDGPDGIKRKTPAQDEPWHYYDPSDSTDKQLLGIIEEHYQVLVDALRAGNKTRAAFEAAWLSHALVDGLTPAHHYPYEEELMRLRGGEGIETRTSPKEKVLMPGDTISSQLRNNWQMWGDKGLLATHIAFEVGVAVVILPLRLRRARPTDEELALIGLKNGYLYHFESQAQAIAELKLYEQFYKNAWTPKLARQVRRELAPRIVNTVALTWYAALQEAQERA